MKKYVFLLTIGLLLWGCKTSEKEQSNEVYKSQNLIIYKISDQVYEHISFMQTIDYGLVPCNGMVVLVDNEAVVFDTPVDHKSSEELINWITRVGRGKIKAVVVTHFHIDNLGGLDAFHQHQIPSYAYQLTLALAQKMGYTPPQNGFDKRLELSVGDQKVFAEFPGEGHTKDNSIGYFPSGKVLFGGCLIKEIGAGKGNLDDANEKDWPETVEKVRAEYKEIQTVIPGHGQLGGPELLDYTIKVFEK